jgi:tetrahydromethanopterin S-methyltransferase subunit H
MFSFTKKQKVFRIGNISIGGQPGENPTVLFGGVFFKGTPRRTEAKKYLDDMLTLSHTTHIPAIPDFFIRYKKHIPLIIEFINSVLPSHHPFSVDIIDPHLKPEVLRYLAKHDLLHRTIYNSIHIGITEKERKTLHKYTPAMAIILAFNPKDNSPDGRLEILENSAHLLNAGLLKIAREAGIERILIDTAAMAPGENSGAAIASIPVIKEEYGLPVGCAIHNVVEKSQWLTSFKKSIVDASSNTAIPLFGGDYALYGPLTLSSSVFPLIAWEDILISEYVENYFGVKPCPKHPRKRFFS